MITFLFKSDSQQIGSMKELVIPTSLKDDINAVCKGYEMLNHMPEMDKFCLYKSGKQISVWMV